MRSLELSADYVRRAKARLAAVDALFAEQSWADVVRESQEVVELALKGLLRAVGIEPPRIHDVSDVLMAETDRLKEDYALGVIPPDFILAKAIRQQDGVLATPAATSPASIAFTTGAPPLKCT